MQWTERQINALKNEARYLEDVMEEYCSSMKWSIGKIGICTRDPLWGVSDKYSVTVAIYCDVVSQQQQGKWVEH